MITPRARPGAHRLAALFAFTSLTAALVAPGCNIIEAQQDCEDACAELDRCGVAELGSCSGYCAGMVAGSVVAGCGDEFDAQNTCALANNDCAAGAATCAIEVAAFATCMKGYCDKNPSGQGCPG